MNRLQKIARICAEYELIPVIFAAVISAAAESFLLPAFVIVAGCALLRWIGTGKISRRTLLDYGIIGLLVMTLVTLAITLIPEKTLPQVLRLWVSIGLFYSLVNWMKSLRRIEIALAAAGIAAVLLAGMALLSVEWVTDKIRVLNVAALYAIPTLIADKIHPNVMAGNLAVLVPLPLALAIFGRKPFGALARWLYAGFFLGAAGVLVLTQSRGAYLALAAALLGMAWLWRPWAGGILTLAGLGGLGYLYLTGFDFLQAYHWLIFSGGDTLGIRMEIWTRALFILQDFPFTGIGMGCFQDVVNTLYPLRPEPVTMGHAHQIFLQVGVDLGIPGLIAWTACFLTVIGCSWTMYRKGQKKDVWWLSVVGAGCLCSAIALGVNGLFDAVTWGTRAAFLPWMVWGLCMGAWAARERMRYKKRVVDESGVNEIRAQA